MRVKRSIVVLSGCLAIVAAAVVYYRSALQPVVGTTVNPSPPAAVEDQDARFRRLAVGTWEDDYKGKRTMTLRDDGTGTMLVELSGLQATLFASKLRFDMTWSINGGRMQKHTTGGEPATTVSVILKTMGDRVDEPILELTEERLLLLDKDGTTKYEWRRKHPAP